jgi:hypothetical protein
MRRKFYVSGLLAISFFLAGVVGPTFGATIKTVAINTTVSGYADGLTSGSWRCGAFWGFTGRNRLSTLGSLSLDGFFSEGCVPTIDPPFQRLRRLTLKFVAGNGDTLTLQQIADWCWGCDYDYTNWLPGDPLPPLPDEYPTVEAFIAGPPHVWVVEPSLSTGKYAGYTGSGTYSVALVGSGDLMSATVSVTLVGSLTASKE